MKCLCQVKSACHKWLGIHLVDRCLLVILGLLMLQSMLNLFLHGRTSTGTNNVDVVIRTSAASIFGYLISANFNQHHKRPTKKQSLQGTMPIQTASGGGPAVTAQIGFQSESGAGAHTSVPQPPVFAAESEPQAAEHRCDRSQILVVASVGTISLMVLLVFRNFMPESTVGEAAITQFRDFVSGSVGFLISCSTSGMENTKG